jgi:hypothetical protein
MASPPPLPAHIPHKKRTMTVIIVVMLALLVCLGMIIVCLLVSFDNMAHYLSRQMQGVVEPHFSGSYADTFQVTVLQVTHKPHSLEEHIQVRCENDMKASIWVADIEKVGMFGTNNADGQVYYRDGDPNILGDTAEALAVKGFSTCRIVFRVFTTSSNSVWHTQMSIGTTNVVGGFENAGGTDSTLPTPLAITRVQTNWPGSYQRDSEIPLANLGHYKILLSIK